MTVIPSVARWDEKANLLAQSQDCAAKRNVLKAQKGD